MGLQVDGVVSRGKFVILLVSLFFMISTSKFQFCSVCFYLFFSVFVVFERLRKRISEVERDGNAVLAPS